jgi:hypothetical protein
VQGFRKIGRIFQARATYRIANGNIDGAIEDKLTMHRLGRLAAQGGPLVQHLVGIAIEGMAYAIPIGANPEHPLTEQQIRHIIAGLDALPPRSPHTDAYEMERYMALSAVQAVARFQCRLSELNESTQPVFWEIFWDVVTRTSNFNTVYRRINDLYDMLPVSSAEEIESILQTIQKQPRKGNTLRQLMTSQGRAVIVSELFILLFCPGVGAFEEAICRMACSENMQRLALAISLYQCEHEKLPDENWVAQIEKYLGEKPEQYFSCPMNPSPNGETTYAMVQYGDGVPINPDTILLIELTAPVPFDKAIISVDEVLERKRTGSLHVGGLNVAYRNGAVKFLSNDTDDDELRRLLGQVVETD